MKKESIFAICGLTISILAILTGLFQSEVKDFACTTLHLFCVAEANVEVLAYDVWQSYYSGASELHSDEPLDCRDTSLAGIGGVGSEFIKAPVLSATPAPTVPDPGGSGSGNPGDSNHTLLAPWTAERYLILRLTLNFKRETATTVTVDYTLQHPPNSLGEDHENGSFKINTQGNSRCEDTVPILQLSHQEKWYKPGEYSLHVRARGIGIAPVSASYTFQVKP